MSEKFTEDLFDLKNDRRMSVYLYRAGFGAWLLYVVSGARFLHPVSTYRTDFGVFSFFLMVMGLSASMIYDYYHHPAEFEQKKEVAGIQLLSSRRTDLFLHLPQRDRFFTQLVRKGFY